MVTSLVHRGPDDDGIFLGGGGEVEILCSVTVFYIYFAVTWSQNILLVLHSDKTSWSTSTSAHKALLS
jgi:hypothetical protein